MRPVCRSAMRRASSSRSSCRVVKGRSRATRPASETVGSGSAVMVGPPGSDSVVSSRPEVSPAVTCASYRTGPDRRTGLVLDDAGLDGPLLRGGPARQRGDALGLGQEPDGSEIVRPAGAVTP